jgi:hypothetical protein
MSKSTTFYATENCFSLFLENFQISGAFRLAYLKVKEDKMKKENKFFY